MRKAAQIDAEAALDGDASNPILGDSSGSVKL
jgi:hypothetical protein